MILEEQSASFIVRIWKERESTATEEFAWRGSIEQVQTGEKKYFHDLRYIQTFMKPFMEDIGVKTSGNFWELMSDSVMAPLIKDADE